MDVSFFLLEFNIFWVMVRSARGRQNNHKLSLNARKMIRFFLQSLLQCIEIYFLLFPWKRVYIIDLQIIIIRI